MSHAGPLTMDETENLPQDRWTLMLAEGGSHVLRKVSFEIHVHLTSPTVPVSGRKYKILGALMYARHDLIA